MKEKSTEISKYQKFEAVTINRNGISNAPYNPRKISDYAIKQLRKNFKDKGFLGGIVWNETTGNLISGHQRLKVLDSLEKNGDYQLTVDKVSMTIKQEKEQNVFMNNQTVQGEYDLDLLKDLFDNSEDFNFDATGFNDYDMAYFGIQTEVVQTKEDKSIEELLEIHDKIKEGRKNYRKEQDKTTNSNYFICLLFNDSDEKVKFFEKYGFVDELDPTYIKADDFIKIISKQILK